MKSIISFYLPFLVSIYSLSFRDINGKTISMSSFQGKKILIVNMASGSQRVSQLSGLSQLQQQHQDSLVVIIFPSNSFGNEPKSNAEIKDFCYAAGNPGFLIAEKCQVAETGLHPIFSWLANSEQNGVMSSVIFGDFYKVLIEKDGKLAGVFAPAVQPTDSLILDAIINNPE